MLNGTGTATLRVMVIDSGSFKKGPQFGGSEISIKVTAPKVLCKEHEYVPLPPLRLSLHLVLGVVECHSSRLVSRHVKDNACVSCVPGKTHLEGADASGADTECKGAELSLLFVFCQQPAKTAMD